jgi:hypothetical protein
LNLNMPRSCRQLTALLALFAFVASFGLPFLAPRHAWIDDPDSGWTVVVPALAHHAPQVATATPTREAGHCAICHWMRALGNSMVGASAGRSALDAIRPRLIEVRTVVVSAPAPAGPARAPPVSLA